MFNLFSSCRRMKTYILFSLLFATFGCVSIVRQPSGSSKEPASESMGQTFYLSPRGSDANAGTQDSPWETIRKAASVVNPGDTVILMDGAYEEPEIAFKRSGTASQPITIRAQNRWQAIVSSISGCQPGMSIYASYIHIKGIRFSVSSNNVQCKDYSSANVHIRAWNSGDAKPLNQTSGYVGFRADNIKVDHAQRSEGLKSNQDFTVIENSEFLHSIELFNSKNSVIRNNLVTGQGKYGVSIFAKGGVRSAQIYQNVIRNKAVDGQGIIIGGFSCDSCHYDTSANIEAYNTVAFNNVVINESKGSMAGLMFQGAKDSAFFNNIVVNGGIAMTVGGREKGPEAPTHNPTFKNNIVLCNGESLTSEYHGWSATGSISIDYNNFSTCIGAPQQDHPVNGSVLFANELTDWSLQRGSSAIDSGIPVTFKGFGGENIDVSRDFLGVIRTAPWDLGIFNVVP